MIQYMILNVLQNVDWTSFASSVLSAVFAGVITATVAWIKMEKSLVGIQSDLDGVKASVSTLHTSNAGHVKCMIEHQNAADRHVTIALAKIIEDMSSRVARIETLLMNGMNHKHHE